MYVQVGLRASERGGNGVSLVNYGSIIARSISGWLWSILILQHKHNYPGQHSTDWTTYNYSSFMEQKQHDAPSTTVERQDEL